MVGPSASDTGLRADRLPSRSRSYPGPRIRAEAVGRRQAGLNRVSQDVVDLNYGSSSARAQQSTERQTSGQAWGDQANTYRSTVVMGWFGASQITNIWSVSFRWPHLLE